MGKPKPMHNLCAIFVHAGAGFHSRENEAQHLEACQRAAKAGMGFLRNGGSALDAVEMAIIALEDSTITNAGYGSNLNAKGIVEGDASIVDHFGRSGACGAVPSVKNPITLARKIYDQAYKNPGLSRVPPNFVAGEGAADFAWNNGVILVPDDDLIAPGSKARYDSWCKEIAEWEAENPEEAGKDPFRAWICRPEGFISSGGVPLEPHTQVNNGKLVDGAQMLQPETASPGASPPKNAAFVGLDQSMFAGPHEDQSQDTKDATQGPREQKDTVTDTVGAIAVDMYGNIAAGSSSGGIGMKHRGRVGPAALIGIGTHVVPVDPTDPEQTAVAAVTSGTGEHIASTFGAMTCSTRIYYGQRMGRAGCFDVVSEEEAISAMIKNEFAGHPAVVNSEFHGSIGILCVKRNVDGIALYFAHNTESFAVGSMSSYDASPNCVMSRNVRGGAVAQGGVKFRYRESSEQAEQKDKKKKRKADKVS